MRAVMRSVPALLALVLLLLAVAWGIVAFDRAVSASCRQRQSALSQLSSSTAVALESQRWYADCME